MTPTPAERAWAVQQFQQWADEDSATARKLRARRHYMILVLEATS